jgi:phosphoribosylanthranilate isomerase
MSVKVKICCIQNRDDARIALDAGVDALGLVSQMPSGPGIISDEEIKSLAAYIPRSVLSILLSSETNPRKLVARILYCGTRAVQLVNYVPYADLPLLRNALPKIILINVVHINSTDEIPVAEAYAPQSDYLLLDSGNPAAEIQTLGGTGKIHNWDISASIVKRVQTPVWLAGGLNPDNVSAAIQKVKPFGVDVCSGVRHNGALDSKKLADFLQAIHAGNSQ